MIKILLLIFTFIMSIYSYSFQIIKEFPVTKGFDDSILTNQMIEFKGFSGQGYFILEHKNLKNLDIFINGKKIKIKNIQGDGIKKVDISKYTKNDKNNLYISSLEGEIVIKIPFPKIMVDIQKNEKTKFLDEFFKSQIKAGFPSIQLTVIKDGRLIYQNSFGYVNNYDKDKSFKR